MLSPQKPSPREQQVVWRENKKAQSRVWSLFQWGQPGHSRWSASLATLWPMPSLPLLSALSRRKGYKRMALGCEVLSSHYSHCTKCLRLDGEESQRAENEGVCWTGSQLNLYPSTLHQFLRGTGFFLFLFYFISYLTANDILWYNVTVSNVIIITGGQLQWQISLETNPTFGKLYCPVGGQCTV